MRHTLFLESIRTGLASLGAHRTRTLLSTSGVVIGVLALVASLSVIDGVDRWSRILIERESSVQDIVVSVRAPSHPERQERIHHRPSFTIDDWRAARRRIPHTSSALMTVSGQVPALANGHHRIVRLTAATANLPQFTDVAVLDGRFFTEVDLEHNADVIVLGYRLATELAQPRDPLWLVGHIVRLGDQRRQVVGILAPRPGETDLVAFIPLGRSAQLPALRAEQPELRVKAASVEAVPQAREAVMDWVAERFPLQRNALTVTVGLERLRNTEQAILLSKLIFGFLIALMLGIGGIGIMNVLLASIAERTREIGIRKAVGARARDIYVHVLAESLAISALGSVIGTVLGAGAALAATSLFRRATEAQISPVFTTPTFLMAGLAAVLVGTTFGSYPARLAARITPIEAIQRE